MSLNAFVRPAKDWELSVGIYNAQDGGTVSGRRGLSADFDEAFFIGQVDRTWEAEDLGHGRLAFGAWHHTGNFARFDGGMEGHAAGAYLVFEQSVAGLLDGFVQLGTSDNDVSVVRRHFAAGVLSAEPLLGETWRPGLYATLAELSDDPGAGLGADELALEIVNEIALTPNIRVKPDLQFIVDPGGNRGIDNAWVATLRVEVTL